MCRNKHAIKGSLLLFAAFGVATLLSTLIGGKVFAAQSTSNGIYVDSTTGVRWEYELITDTDNQVNPQTLTIRYYDKPVDATTVKVPSLADLISGIAGATNDLNTYFLKDADTAAQDTAYGASYPRVTTSTPTTVLDMSATNKIQIMGVKPIIDPDVETELIFGDEMVIGDTYTKSITATRCNGWTYNEWNPTWWGYDCIEEDIVIDPATIPGWSEKTLAEKISYIPTPEDFSCIEKGYFSSPERPVEGQCYYRRFNQSTTFVGGAFSGYKLKLTGFSADKFNYVGWYAFKDSTLNEDNTTITVSGNSMLGGEMFAGTNVKNVIINTNTYGTEMFKDCQGIESVTFGNETNTIMDGTFAGTNLTSFDFSNTGIKEIKARAFQGAQLTQINLDGVERIGYRAFMGNDIRELTLPKSINYLDVELFRDNYNMKKLTVAYDTMTSGTLRAMFVTLDNIWHGTNQPSMTIEELTILAPYSANEQVKATHLSMEDYVYNYRDEDHDYGCRMGHWSDNANYWIYKLANTADRDDLESIDYCKALSEPEKLYAKLDEKKNIIAPNYFSEFDGLSKIIIGDGIEYIGASAFATQKAYSGTGSAEWEAINDTINKCERNDPDCIGGSRWSSMRKISKISIPDSVKGIGAMAFGAMYSAGMDISIPRNIEYIGQAAFKNAVSLEIDVDFPNLVFLGDNAFAGTMVRNVHLYDKLEYLGYMVFYGAYNLNDITFDLDLFDPEKLYVGTRFSNDDFLFTGPDRWGDYETITANNYSGEMRASFGDSTGHSIPCERAEAWGLNWDCNGSFNFGHHQVFGKITFTEKVVHEPFMPVTNGAGGDGFFPSGDYAGGMTSSRSDTFLNGIAAAEVDLGAAGWKIIPPIMFNHSQIGKLTLPSGTEVIGAMAFSQALIEEELVLPNTIKVIGDAAFDCGEYVSRTGYTPIIIKKLPTSLEYIGHRAFWGDYNLAADLNAPNLKRIGSAAFQKTHVRDVLIPSGVEWLLRGTFDNVPTLRNITIDANLSEIAVVPETRPDTYQYFPQIMTDYTKGMFPAYKIVDERTPGYGYSIIEEPTFDTIYTIFNQTSKPSATDMNEGQLEAGETYGTLTFGPHATTTIGGKLGTFAGLSFEKVDMSQAKFTAMNVGGDAFYKSKIGTIILPATLQDINYASFMYAEVTNPITLPASLRKVDTGAFQWAKIGGLDIKEGLTEFGSNSFLWAEIGGEFSLPSTLKKIGSVAFMEAKGYITNMLPEGVEEVGNAAFYQTDMADELTIPSTVTTVEWSAFNANNVDVHYDKVTIKPDLTNSSASGQLVHQLLWHADLDELVVESSMLVGLERYADTNGYQEFYNMPMDKVTITSLPTITYGAFDKCSNLVEVDMSQNANLRDIKTEAFLDAEKLHIIKFSPALKNETVNVGQRAFVNTAFETMGDSTKEFDLTAAKFNATPQGLAFAWMPKLRTLDIPRNFSNNTIPVATFYNDTDLEEVTVDYKITLIDNGAFVNDTKIKKVFIWGNTVVKNDGLEGYTAPEWFGQGGDDDDDTDADPVDPVNPATLTIPGQADIYAYSVSPTEEYAKLRGDENLTGTFYPLDEVLYLTSNKPTVLLSDDESDFDKSDLIVYGLRRDGLVLESDEWAQYDGVVYPRSARPLTFEKMAATVAADPAFGTVYDTPVPLNELNVGNENFAAIDFAIVPAVDDPAVRIVNIVYTDGYTGGEPDTDIDPRQVTPDPTPVIPDEPDDPVEPDNPVNPDEPEPEPEPQPEPEPEVEPEPETPAEPEKPETPVTNDELGKYIAIFAGSFAAGFGLLGYMFFTRRKQR